MPADGSGTDESARARRSPVGAEREERAVDALETLVDRVCAEGRVPGAVALIATGDGRRHVAVGGSRAVGGAATTRDTLFRIASITKPIVAAATMVLVERGRFGLDDAVEAWLPELTAPRVLRSPTGPLDDVVPADRPITVRDLLTFRAGHGFVGDFSAPVVRVLLDRLHQGPPQPQVVPRPDEWMARLAEVPLVHQPGRGWTYNTGSDVLGVLLARAESAPLADVLRDAVLDPLGMRDTGFVVPAEDLHRFTGYYRRDESGDLELVDAPDGQWASAPAFPSGAGGLVSTVDDWCTFGRMLLDGGRHAGREVLSAESVRRMTTPQAYAEPGNIFLDGQAWGFGGSVDVDPTRPWNVPGRYGWVGGTGTAGYVLPSAGVVAVWLSQVELGGPADFGPIGEFLTLAAAAA
jgi:CubicO group peptidase (beta-lactamase class C family)